MTITQGATHPDEGDLIRLLDNELDPQAADGLELHLAVCEECAATLQLLSATASDFSAELQQDIIEVPVARPLIPHRAPPRRMGWRIAAAIAVLLPLSATLRPVRAFVRSGWLSVVEALGFTQPNQAEPAPVPEPPANPGAIVAFVPRGATFAVDVMSWQESGSVHLEFGSADNASAQIMTPGSAEEILVVPNSGIRIGNASSSVSDYRIVLPEGVQHVSVRVAGEEIADIDVDGRVEPLSISLGRR